MVSVLMYITAELVSSVGLEDASDCSRYHCGVVFALEGFGECSSYTQSQLKFSATCQTPGTGALEGTLQNPVALQH